ncbi:MAG TPA: phage holin, LLH family, partial [Ktedonobacteraceae bacterium]|nr:phage holin, LLH family [Ktedonobacteraceae bacterium]
MTETQILTIITALTPLYPFLFALAAALFKWLLTKLPKDRQTEINQVIQTVVQGVEQSGAGKSGPEKK